MVICLEQGVDLHMARLMPLPLTVSCFSEIQIGFISLVPAHPDSPRKGPLNVCVCLIILVIQHRLFFVDCSPRLATTVISVSYTHLTLPTKRIV